MMSFLFLTFQATEEVDLETSQAVTVALCFRESGISCAGLDLFKVEGSEICLPTNTLQLLTFRGRNSWLQTRSSLGAAIKEA